MRALVQLCGSYVSCGEKNHWYHEAFGENFEILATNPILIRNTHALREHEYFKRDIGIGSSGGCIWGRHTTILNSLYIFTFSPFVYFLVS
jgi:hypothetical protein